MEIVLVPASRGLRNLKDKYFSLLSSCPLLAKTNLFRDVLVLNRKTHRVYRWQWKGWTYVARACNSSRSMLTIVKVTASHTCSPRATQS